ncbi:hypothetical protein ACOZ38_06660 [Sphaerisporangium viridialbum]|uniref:hypothetical protein n=1 Tax=Sphaerisporangium viridialbum TaxID=46189 RepID=UPI003C73F6CA
MLAQTHDTEEIIERVAALDVGKATLVCCARVPDDKKPSRRLQEVQTYATMTRSLLVMADRLRCLGVTRVVMEATSDYWKPVAMCILRHSQISMTMDVYTQIPSPETRKELDRLNKSLGDVWFCRSSI